MAANIRSEFSDYQWYQWQPMAANGTNGKITNGTIGKTPNVPCFMLEHDIYRNCFRFGRPDGGSVKILTSVFCLKPINLLLFFLICYRRIFRLFENATGGWENSEIEMCESSVCKAPLTETYASKVISFGRDENGWHFVFFSFFFSK